MDIQAWLQQGIEHLNTGRLEEAAQSFGRAAEIAPNNDMAWHGLGLAALHAGRIDEALASLKKAASLAPDSPQILNTLGDIYRQAGQLDDARRCLEAAVAKAPEYAEAHNNLGAVNLVCEQVEQAVEAFSRAIQLNPALALAHFNLGMACMQANRPEAAVSAFRQAIAIQPEFVEAHVNLGMALLKLGQLGEGFDEYEWRLNLSSSRHDYFYSGHPAPLWRNEPLAGKTILLYAEQGLGDTLQFIRFAPMVKQLGARLVVECQPALVRLLKAMDGIDAVYAKGETLPPHDYQIPLMSLPQRFGVRSPERIPAPISYFQPEKALLEQWGKRFSAGAKLKVGLVWAGDPRPDDASASLIDRRRSLNLSLLEPLFSVPDVDFYSLQKGKPGQQAKNYPGRLIDLTVSLQDFAETAALIAHLDLVIAVDTAVPHLAAAMGKPVWLLSRFDGCWRWMQQGDRTPWYPSMRLFRQAQAGEWGALIERLARALRTQIAAQADKHDGTRGAAQFMNTQVWLDKGLALLGSGDLDAAEDSFRSALAAQPDNADALHGLGLAALQRGKPDDALALLLQAQAAAPESPAVLNTLGDVYRQLNRLDEAYVCLKEALRLAPAYAEAYSNLGAVLLSRGQLPQAQSALINAVQLKPELAMAQFNLGVTYRELCEPEQAVAAFRQAVAVKPEFVEAHVSLGMALLTQGKMDEGFAEYEWRLKLDDRHYPGPQWDGVLTPGKTLFVHLEQGYGDAIQFSRYLAFVASGGMRVIVQCAQPLQLLFLAVSGVSLVCGPDEELPPYDAHCSLMSLPGLFQTRLDRIPLNIPYLTLPFGKISQWRQRLSAYGETIKIGLRWRGNPHYGADQDRSCDLRQFEALAGMPGVSWVSLQDQPPSADEAEVAAKLGLIDVSAELTDFMDTAALIDQLSLVVSVDTAVLHLAGALGKTSWALLRYAPDWRWMLDRGDSPWYPSMRLFRQSQPGQWDEPIAQASAMLRGVMEETLDTKAT
ncbi:MAG: tetratricopeptide repeat protein [Sulfuricellaceae bacterium]|nr:tetratricopeptide repeat protein [Sulfuricellaceae bacterium]